MQLTFQHTRMACHIALVVQAIMVNLAPLLFVTFRQTFGLSFEQLGLLITVNFGVQIVTDIVAVRHADQMGYRAGMVGAQVFALLGLIFLGVLPYAGFGAYAGLVVAVVFMAVGSGLMEVLVSPVLHSLPIPGKHGAMSLLHACYCWGHMAVVLLSTLYFLLFGREHWRWLPVLWGGVPLMTALLFLRVPIRHLIGEGETAMPLRRLFSRRLFFALLFIMICSGASEQAMGQWASLFAETGLGVSKTLGDLLGPCLFAVMMAVSRTFFGYAADRLDMRRVLAESAMLSVVGYLAAVFSPWPLLSLAGCGICGLAAGIMWPGTLSLAAEQFPLGGTAMFGVMALAGDVGCAAGPAVVGFISGAVERAGGVGWLAAFPGMGGGVESGLKAGLLAAAFFPVLLAVSMTFVRRRAARRSRAAPCLG